MNFKYAPLVASSILMVGNGVDNVSSSEESIMLNSSEFRRPPQVGENSRTETSVTSQPFDDEETKENPYADEGQPNCEPVEDVYADCPDCGSKLYFQKIDDTEGDFYHLQ